MLIQDMVFANGFLATGEYGNGDSSLALAISEVVPSSYTLIVLNTLSSTILACLSRDLRWDKETQLTQTQPLQ